ncbi:MAG: DPP IV N-terminal domain-containing protein [Bacteroidota bacterium]
MNRINSYRIIQTIIFLWICSTSIAQNAKLITVEDIWQKYLFYPDAPDDITPMKDGKYFSMLEDKILINKFEYKSGNKIETILNTEDIVNPITSKPLGAINEFSFSQDEKKILLSTESKNIYRRSKEAWFWVYNRQTKKTELLFDKGKQRLADFSPDGTMVAFVYLNNLYIKNLNTNKVIQITTDGKDREIINGTTDWVYEEELDITKGFTWSDDGSQIAYMRFDESKVKEFSMTKWGKLYPEEYKYKYPKAGEANSIVDIYIYNVAENSSKKLNTGSETDQYIPRIQWLPNNNQLVIMRMNRLQNKYSLHLYANDNKTSRVIYCDSSKYWVEVPENFNFINQSQLITTSEADGYNHIYQITFSDKKGNPTSTKITQITKGQWIVRNIIGIDSKKGKIYYSSSESSSINHDLFTVNFDGSNKTKLSSNLGTWDAQFNSDYSYYIGTFSDANTAPIVSIYDNQGILVRSLINNDRVNKLSSEYHFQPKKFFTINTSQEIKLNAWMIKPENFDSTKKYPVLMYVYGGPGNQSVENKWGYFDLAWYQMLCQKGYIVVCIDNRGTGGKGEAFQKCTYMQLGKYETEDQIEGAKYLASLSYIDGGRIGIWGWSYGGYMSSLCITKGAEYFKTAIAVAPVTNWRNYDNIYTERFMRTPQVNADGYDNNSPSNFAKKLKGNYFIIHGSADDNVHYQNSMEFINQLIKENKQFNQFVYPNRNHNISGGNSRYHLYNMLTDYILKNL